VTSRLTFEKKSTWQETRRARHCGLICGYSAIHCGRNVQARFLCRLYLLTSLGRFRLLRCVSNYEQLLRSLRSLRSNKVFIKIDYIPGAIIGNGERKSWDLRGAMIWDNCYIFSTSWRHVSARIHTHVGGRSRECCAWSEWMVRVARFSCRFFTAMAGNKASNKI